MAILAAQTELPPYGTVDYQWCSDGRSERPANGPNQAAKVIALGALLLVGVLFLLFWQRGSQGGRPGGWPDGAPWPP